MTNITRFWSIFSVLIFRGGHSLLDLSFYRKDLPMDCPLYLCVTVTRCLGPLSLCQLRLNVVAGSPILMTQKLSLNECILCFGTICQPICLFSVICLETNGEKRQDFTLARRKMTCANIVQISVTQRFITKTIFWTFFFAECIFNHIDTLFKFMTCFMQKNNNCTVQNISKYFNLSDCYQLLLNVTASESRYH